MTSQYRTWTARKMPQEKVSSARYPFRAAFREFLSHNLETLSRRCALGSRWKELPWIGSLEFKDSAEDAGNYCRAVVDGKPSLKIAKWTPCYERNLTLAGELQPLSCLAAVIGNAQAMAPCSDNIVPLCSEYSAKKAKKKGRVSHEVGTWDE